MKTRTIGQCKDCFYFCIFVNGKTRKYTPKYALFCQHNNLFGGIAFTEGVKEEDFGCWHWKEKKCETK